MDEKEAVRFRQFKTPNFFSGDNHDGQHLKTFKPPFKKILATSLNITKILEKYPEVYQNLGNIGKRIHFQ